MAEITLENVTTPTQKRSGLTVTLVKSDGNPIGLLEKYRNTRTDKHPWKAFKGIGKECTFLKSFYPEEGGKDAAILAIVHEAGLCPCGGQH